MCEKYIFREKERETHNLIFYSKFHNSILICRSFFPFFVSPVLLFFSSTSLGENVFDTHVCHLSTDNMSNKEQLPNFCSGAYSAKFVFRGIQRQICVPRHTDKFVFRNIQRQICVPRHTAPNLCS